MVTSAAENPVPEVPLARPSDPPKNEDGHVLKSRRGLLAAGLAVAVVGTIGVASTLTAGAGEIDVPLAPPAAAADNGEDTSDGEAADAPPVAAASTPPAVLPWGAKPKKVKRGKPGISSQALRGSGADVAPADASGSVVPKARYGPKGRSNRSSALRTEVTEVAPPSPAPTTSSSSSDTKVNYLYNVGMQAAETDGAYANITIAKPFLAKSDYHSLAEIAVQSADGAQIVEVGWTVDRLVNGDTDPHLFVYHWVNRKTTCYNSCGFVQYSKNIKPGDTLAYDVTKKFGIRYFNGAWWIAYDSEWVGYFPEALWYDEGVKFNRSGLVQIFGEVAATSDKPCTEMGNGIAPSESTSALVGSVSFLNGPSVALQVRSTTDTYRVSALSSRTFRYGGPGNC